MIVTRTMLHDAHLEAVTTAVTSSRTDLEFQAERLYASVAPDTDDAALLAAVRGLQALTTQAEAAGRALTAKELRRG